MGHFSTVFLGVFLPPVVGVFDDLEAFGEEEEGEGRERREEE